ncbi:MAG: hypothetical protein MR727_08410 [Lentisphaeria bacterium]|nr:hypothetical protein [Lentisphaeria bacterium]
MKNFERDVIDRLGRMETRLELLQRLVRGAGQPGMMQKVEMLENRVQSLELTVQSERKNYGKLAAAAAFVINAGIAVGAWFR